jgi:hypothetical protein
MPGNTLVRAQHGWHYAPPVLSGLAAMIPFALDRGRESHIVVVGLVASAIVIELETCFFPGPRPWAKWVAGTAVTTSLAISISAYTNTDHGADPIRRELTSSPRTLVGFARTEFPPGIPGAAVLPADAGHVGEEAEQVAIDDLSTDGMRRTFKDLSVVLLLGERYQVHAFHEYGGITDRYVVPGGELIAYVGDIGPVEGVTTGTNLGFAFEGTPAAHQGMQCSKDWTGFPATISPIDVALDPYYVGNLTLIAGLSAGLMHLDEDDISSLFMQLQISSAGRIRKAAATGSPGGLGRNLVCGVGLKSGFRVVVVAVAGERKKALFGSIRQALFQLVEHYRPAEVDELRRALDGS